MSKKYKLKTIGVCLFIFLQSLPVMAQKKESVRISEDIGKKKINVYVGNRLFTTFLYPDSLEKPVLYPVYTSGGTIVTRGFPLDPRPGEPTDHPHHLGVWFNFENVNGLDFWNNSYAIPKEKKHLYGWIHVNKITKISSGRLQGSISYQAGWNNQQKETLLQENTRLEFSGSKDLRIIDRVTVLTADTVVTFTDVKDGMLGMRIARELQIPLERDQRSIDERDNPSVAKNPFEHQPNGNYITSEGIEGDEAWGTRARWCKVYGKMGKDSVSITIFDHPKNINYPGFWHARGYGLFAINPLGERIFTNGKSYKDLKLEKGDSVTFRFRIVVSEGNKTITSQALNQLADEFAGTD